VAQLKRRHRAIESLRSHAGLLRLLERPEDVRQDVGGDASIGDHDSSQAPRFGELDGSKRNALSAILSTQPIYALQGPPGTGKTHLLDAMVTDLLTGTAQPRCSSLRRATKPSTS
jgi:Cdc6-like AAA superfamily ATPase